MSLVCRKGLIFALLVLFFSGGCSNTVSNRIAALNDARIKQLTNLYNGYQRSHAWHGPRDEASLKQFVQRDMDPNKLALMNVDPNRLEELFISPRDQKPFKVKYGVGGGPGANVAVVFEDTGIEGKRQVGFTGPIVEEVEDSRYKDLWSAQATTPEERGAGPRQNAFQEAASKK
jgi:hypothetical protein